ncbi:hypothetical protein KUH03_27245 [Sphingobacterium sp. E70]|uniref:hypothetical protein n=1 Tax=Sphingobacterium sp. E70 TaxID=2853439 RepID=UPI00211B9FD0|nr:hypothetical protein [Sphingobacterium sp. E70]ULT22944.1 hypothetical protein KUH03_27245 [Sphingobacterium sp. E70]
MLLLTGFAQAQELYTPRNIKQAIEKGTRTTTGVPGKNYWQNFGKYDVKVQLDPAAKTVRGKETILYTNNSPDTLKQLAIRFVNNVHKPNAARANYASDDYLTSGLKIKSFKLNGQVYEVNSGDWEQSNSVILGRKFFPEQWQP